MKKIIFILLAALLFSCQNNKEKKQEKEKNGSLSPALKYEQLQQELQKGWNTWDNRSIMTQVLLPDGWAIILHLENKKSGDTLKLAFPGNRVKNSEKVKTIAHTPDGSYTDFTLKWQGIEMQVQSISENKHISILVTPLNNTGNNPYINVNSKIFYEKPGKINFENNSITFITEEYSSVMQVIGKTNPAQNNVIPVSLQQPVLLTTKKQATLEGIKNEIALKAEAYKKKVASYGDYAESYNAIQNVMNWNVVYDPVKDRVVTPVARTWAYGWGKGKIGGYVLFCWDNFFAAYMHAIENKALAYNEAIQMCNEIDDLGFVPNYSGPGNVKSRDRSQPPVGAMMVKEIYKMHPEKWFLEKTFDQLLTWNRWWKDNRDQEGFLAWGSTPFKSPTGDKRELVQNVAKAASNESGLDNTPMMDGVPYDTTIHMFKQADVGLMGLYIGDCQALAEIAREIGRKQEAKELEERAEYYRNNLKKLWSEDVGLFLNKRLDTKEFSHRISPTNFYALIANAATQKQAERMINEHFYNPEEFWGEWIMPSISRNDTAYTGIDYWRGSIWAPMNFLVYYGMCNYNLPKAKKDLSQKSKKLLMKEWLEKAYVRENYNAETGGGDHPRSEHFYHWGALLGMINMIENDFVPPIEKSIE